MVTSFRFLLILAVTFFTSTALITLHAQEASLNEHILYYLAADADGIHQVHQHLLDSDKVRQLTNADENVTHFGVAYDGLSVAYISEEQLWLQPVHTQEPETLTTLTTIEHLSNPIYSPDGQYIAYTDNGVWLLNLTTRETRQLLINVPLDLPRKHVNTLRTYRPQQFVLDTGGEATKLVIDIDIWEWNTVGVYDLTTHSLQEFETEEDVWVHTDLLVLSDGCVLLYGNNLVGGEPALHITESLDDINTYTRILDFASLTEKSLFAHQAVEIQPGVVRLSGAALTIDAGQLIAEQVFTFDYDTATDIVSDINLVTVAENINQTTIQGPISPDGMLIPFLSNLIFEDNRIVSSEGYLLNLETGTLIVQPFTGVTGLFQWQPLP